MMKKWIFGAIGYLLVVIIGYSIYTSMTSPPNTTDSHGEHAHESAKDTHGAHEGHVATNKESEVDVKIEAKDDQLKIGLTDLQGESVEELEINHEKLLHLIIVDEHLDQYFHLHPEETEPGVYVVDHQLEEGVYKAFVDIKPKGLSYTVTPLEFTIGEASAAHHHPSLEVDTEFEKTVNGQTASLEISSLKANEDVTISFTFPEGAELQPYLGAMGHVVILNETAANYLHVHPVDNKETKFETMFPSPGIYKLWGEFQIEDEVYIFPFTVNVE
ncbi:hypothetical protein JOC85_004009 [Bacillus mesophilus]|uniref:Secreted protein n=1 Tax=Bacillus mesophilus TaxID=1808955 RepID=A0A6M0QE11_9BACI|nr:hypothetical protein [Bacillus mesophilus]MBM7663156.1 hypothetical protein [Bacillus mesophilus]NEY73870.1 hypothetical protein [Bacillus mesophilus]